MKNDIVDYINICDNIYLDGNKVTIRIVIKRIWNIYVLLWPVSRYQATFS